MARPTHISNKFLWSQRCSSHRLIVLRFNDTSSLVGHFVSFPREREKTDRRDSSGDKREGLGRKRNRNEREATEEIKTVPSTLTCYKYSKPCPTVSQYQLDAPVTQGTRHLRHTRPPLRAIEVRLYKQLKTALKAANTLSREATLSKLVCLPSEKGLL